MTGSGQPDDPQAHCSAITAEVWGHPQILQASRAHHFGYLLRAFRMAHQPRLTQASLAHRLGITQSQLSRVESGKSGGTDLNRLVAWARVLCVPQSILWFDTATQDAERVTMTTKPSRPIPRRDVLAAAGLGTVLLGAGSALEVPGNSIDPTPRRRVGSTDVESIRYWTGTFRSADNQRGGGDTLDMARHFLSQRVVPLLRESKPAGKAGAALFAAAAELYQLVGWMSYDVGDTKTGRKTLRLAFQISQDLGDSALSAEMLSAMSHHAAFLRHSDDALDLALAARQLATRTGNHALVAETAAMEAHGHALNGDVGPCLTALHDSEAHFMQISNNDNPEWLSYLDQAYLSAKFGHVLRDLGRPQDAEPFARQSLQMIEGYDRGRMFNTALLAGILADEGAVEEAVATSDAALHMSTTVKSSRAVGYMTDVAQRLQPYSNHAPVQDLYRRMTARQIPLMLVA